MVFILAEFGAIILKQSFTIYNKLEFLIFIIFPFSQMQKPSFGLRGKFLLKIIEIEVTKIVYCSLSFNDT